MELKKHTDEAASKVAAVLQRAEDQGRMIESLHTSVCFYYSLTFILLLASYFINATRLLLLLLLILL